jgi:hypothetical protein
MATISATAGSSVATVAVTVADDDTLGIALAASSLTIGEAGSGMVGVKLTAQPLVDTTVTLASSDGGAATVTPSLVFTPLNWNQYQDAVVTGVADLDTANEAVTINLSGAGTKSFAVTVLDDDTLGVATDVPAVTLGEGGTGQFKVKLTAQPAASVTVAIASADAGAVTAAPASLTFTTANWNTYQAVTLTGVQDNDLANETVPITLMSSGLVIPDVTATVLDDDTQVVQVSAPTLGITEGATGTFTVTLKYVPTGTTTVTLASDNLAGATVSPASLTLDASTYATGKAVTVTGVQDADAVAAMATISATAGSSVATVAVTVADDDTLGIALDVSAVTVVEGGAAGQVGVKLTAQPLVDTTVTLASPDTGAATVTPSLTFTPLDWNQYKYAAIVGVQDNDVANESVALSVSGPGTSKTVAVTVTDDDTQVVQVTPASLAMLEGGPTKTFDVTLKYAPSGTVAVTVTSGNTAVATVSAPSLTFSAANYGTAQTVTVTAVDDSDTLAGATVITAASASAMPGLVSVAVTDDDFTPTVPQLARPMNGAYVGSAIAAGTRKPKFTWRPATVQGAHGLTYDLQYSSDKTFAAGVTTVAGLTPLTFQPAADLAISTTVPKGTRYYWRVRACSGAPCSAYSNPYMVNVGRSDHDFNGDGYADLVVGAPSAGGGSNPSGKVYVYFGPGFTASTTKKIIGATGERIGEVLGTGDVNGDGFSDIVLGDYSRGINSTGAVVVYYGAPAFDVSPDVILSGRDYDFLGAYLAVADFNGDGYDDIAAAHGSTNLSMDVYLGGSPMDSVSDVYIPPEPESDRQYTYGLSATDTDGDGYADLARSVGLSSPVAVVTLRKGSAAGLPVAASSTIQATFTGYMPLSAAGDVNGDGYGDFVGIKCSFSCGLDNASVILGSATGPATQIAISKPTTDTGTAWGTAASGVGDINNDGFDDVAISDSSHASGAGGVWLYLGSSAFDGSPDALFPSKGESITGGADVNGDGFADLASGSTTGGAASGGFGQVFFGGSTINTTADLTVNAETAGEEFFAHSSL